VSLTGAETTFGKNVTAGENNVFNWLWNTKRRRDSPMSSITSAIDRATQGLSHKPPYDLSNTGFYTTTYCTSGKTCQAGYDNLNRFVREQGANPNEDLHYPCPRP
jgi:hypothetical protein